MHLDTKIYRYDNNTRRAGYEGVPFYVVSTPLGLRQIVEDGYADVVPVQVDADLLTPPILHLAELRSQWDRMPRRNGKPIREWNFL